MDHGAGCEACASLREERDRLASQLRAQDATLRAAQARIALLEQRLACRGAHSPAPAACVRCAQTSHGLALMQERMREHIEEKTALQREVATLTARVETVEKRNAELEQRVHRCAAPFRRRPEERKPHHNPTGRPKGHPGAWRPAPEGPVPTERVPLPCCPQCQGPVTQVRAVEQVIYEIPLPVEPIARRVVTYTGECAQCGCVRSLHPWQASTAQGAAGVQLGPQALAVAADLRHGHGLPLRRVCRVLGDYFGLTLSSGGLSHALARIATKVHPDYQQLIEELRQSPVIYVDETGWWLEHLGAWLWVFTTPRVTVYLISRKRSAEALEEILGARYEGILVSDCLRLYDRYPAANKGKCVAHHQRKIADARAKLPESPFLVAIQRLLKAALKLRRSLDRLPPEVYARGVTSMEERLTKLLAVKYAQEEEEKIAQRFRNQRPYIFTFLHHPEVEATNNRAERQLRPAVITRKLSWGNETARGAQVWSVLASLAATSRQRGESFVVFVANRLRLGSAATGLAPPTPA